MSRPKTRRQDSRGGVHFNVGWELFVLALALLSVVNLVLYVIVRSDDVAQVVATVDVAITIVFAIDFLARFAAADRRLAYFVHGFGWLDLMACIPGLRIVRLVRVVTVSRRIRARGGFQAVVNDLLGGRAQTILLLVVLLTVLVIEFGSMAILAVEDPAPSGNIETASDALWFLIVTISTIGYGDQFPVTDLGRVIGAVVLVTGIALFTTLTGFLIHYFYGDARARYDRDARSSAEEEIP